MKILIIEDNTRLAERIKSVLSKVYIVDSASSGEEGIDLACSTQYKLIILDLKLPDMNGLNVCSHLRKQKINVPILILTAANDIQSKVRLLGSGADDYLTKPFNMAELNARVVALTRRESQPLINNVLLVNDLEIDVARRQVRRAGMSISLRRKEFDILEYLVHNQGRAVSRDMIINHAWVDGSNSWNNTVDVHIKHLRDKVDKPFDEPLIKTAYGIGYMIDGDT